MIFGKVVLEFQGQTKTHGAYWISKKESKSLDPTAEQIVRIPDTTIKPRF
jgi:hypothetical protein